MSGSTYRQRTGVTPERVCQELTKESFDIQKQIGDIEKEEAKLLTEKAAKLVGAKKTPGGAGSRNFDVRKMAARVEDEKRRLL